MKSWPWLLFLVVLAAGLYWWFAAVQEEQKARSTRIAIEEPRGDRRSPGSNIDPYQAMQVANRLEHEGRSAEAVQMYVSAARGGRCDAAMRLGEIYGKGLPGVKADHAESNKWYNAARVLGCTMQESPAAAFTPNTVSMR